MVDLLKFTTNKIYIYIYIYIEWSYSPNLQQNLLPNFVQSLVMLDKKKFKVGTKFF